MVCRLLHEQEVISSDVLNTQSVVDASSIVGNKDIRYASFSDVDFATIVRQEVLKRKGKDTPDACMCVFGQSPVTRDCLFTQSNSLLQPWARTKLPELCISSFRTSRLVRVSLCGSFYVIAEHAVKWGTQTVPSMLFVPYNRKGSQVLLPHLYRSRLRCVGCSRLSLMRCAFPSSALYVRPVPVPQSVGAGSETARVHSKVCKSCVGTVFCPWL